MKLKPKKQVPEISQLQAELKRVRHKSRYRSVLRSTVYIGVLRIPQLELELPVVSRWSYSALKIAPCRYSGSAYSGGFIIAAHNYRAHFGNLKNLREGDVVTFTDMDGNLFTYTVAECEILPPTAIEEMESGGWDLTLFTCTVGGQSRVTVRCEMEKE